MATPVQQFAGKCISQEPAKKGLLNCSPVVPADAVQQVGLITPKANTTSRKLSTNKKVAEFGASTVTATPFQSGQRDRWWHRKCAPDQPTQVEGVARIQLWEKPRSAGNSHSHEERYSFTSDRTNHTWMWKTKLPMKYTPVQRL
jgi:hypothetical protein